MRNDRRGSLPKMLAGSLCAQWVQCGRTNCRCARGRLHGPYYYRFWREHGRLRKQYVKRQDVRKVRARCEARRRYRRDLAAAQSELRGMWSFLKELGQR